MKEYEGQIRDLTGKTKTLRQKKWESCHRDINGKVNNIQEIPILEEEIIPKA